MPGATAASKAEDHGRIFAPGSDAERASGMAPVRASDNGNPKHGHLLSLLTGPL